MQGTGPRNFFKSPHFLLTTMSRAIFTCVPICQIASEPMYTSKMLTTVKVSCFLWKASDFLHKFALNPRTEYHCLLISVSPTGT